jgi:hypothetical protein
MSRRYSRSGSCLKCSTFRRTLHRDHIIPRWKGGLDNELNYQYICANCHEDKTFDERASQEYRDFVSKQSSERMLSARARARISKAVREANAKRVWTPEMRAKCARPGVKRVPFTEEHKARISVSKTGVKLTKRHRDALSRAHQGKPWTRAHYESRGLQTSIMVDPEQA